MGLKLKVCGMRDPENIQQLAALLPDYMGFIFYAGSRRFVSDLDPRLMQGLPAAIKPVGVFVDESLEKVVQLAGYYPLKAIQLHGSETAEYCRSLKRELSHVALIKAFGVNDSFNFDVLNGYQDAVDFFLFDTQTAEHGGSGKTFNWERLDNYTLKLPYFLSGGIGPEHVIRIKGIMDPRLYAIDLNSRFELAPAMKNIELLTTFKNEL